MTPAINVAKKAGIVHQVHAYEHDPSAVSWGTEAAERLGLPAERVFKTLVVSLDGSALAVAVLPVSGQLNLKQLAKAAGAKKATMANKSEVARITGYVLGGVSPLDQKKPLPTFLDATATDFATVFVSAGRRGLEIELSAQDLQKLTHATCADLRLL